MNAKSRPVRSQWSSTVRTTAGTNSAASTRSVRITSYSRAVLNSSSRPTSTRVPPEHSARTTSPVKTSKAGPAIWRCVRASVSRRYSACQARYAEARLPWETRTAFGRPVEPEVWMT